MSSDISSEYANFLVSNEVALRKIMEFREGQISKVEKSEVIKWNIQSNVIVYACLRPSCSDMHPGILIAHQSPILLPTNRSKLALNSSLASSPTPRSFDEDALFLHALVPVRLTSLPTLWTRLLSAYGDRVSHLGDASRVALRIRVIPRSS